jgi:hypothetical protein
MQKQALSAEARAKYFQGGEVVVGEAARREEGGSQHFERDGYLDDRELASSDRRFRSCSRSTIDYADFPRATIGSPSGTQATRGRVRRLCVLAFHRLWRPSASRAKQNSQDWQSGLQLECSIPISALQPVIRPEQSRAFASRSQNLLAIPRNHGNVRNERSELD